MKYVNQHGPEPKVFKDLMEVLKRDGEWKVIRNRYYKINANPTNTLVNTESRIKTPFSAEEDGLINKYVELFGLNINTLNRLSHELHRNRESIRSRFNLISSNASYEKRSEWTIYDDRTVMECVLKVIYCSKFTWKFCRL